MLLKNFTRSFLKLSSLCLSFIDLWLEFKKSVVQEGPVKVQVSSNFIHLYTVS